MRVISLLSCAAVTDFFRSNYAIAVLPAAKWRIAFSSKGIALKLRLGDTLPKISLAGNLDNMLQYSDR